MKKFKIRLSRVHNGRQIFRLTYVGDNIEQCILKAGTQIQNFSGFTILRGCETKKRIKMADYKKALYSNKVQSLLT